VKRALFILLFGAIAQFCTAQTRTVALSKLREAVTSASSGDTLYVGPGTLETPTIRLDRPLVLIGRGHPVLDGGGIAGLLLITADSVTIDGFGFRNTGSTFMDDRAAVRFEGSSDCAVRNSVFEETFFGVYLAGTRRCEINDNRFETTPERESKGGNAVHSWYSSELTVSGNTIQGHRDGIYLEFTDHAVVRDNVSRGNVRYGLHFMFSNDCAYERNTFERNGAGVAVMYGDHVTMRDNRFMDSWGASSYGLLLKEIKNGEVSGNRFEGNSIGLFVESSDRIAFEDNEFTENGWAVKVMADATGNRFVSNTFMRNTFDVATNSQKTTGSTFNGNYWDRYKGYDLDRDGVGDVPFHPVRLYSVVVERHEPALVLLRSVFVDVLDAVESVLPLLTPEVLVDPRPAMRPFVRS